VVSVGVKQGSFKETLRVERMSEEEVKKWMI
jgi:hypothetical protein